MSATCTNCGSQNLAYQETGVICMSCGQILDSQNITSELGFTENSNGTSSVVGQFVKSGGITGPSGRGAPSGHNRSSSEATILNAKRKISNHANALGFGTSTSVIEAATGLFQQALQSNFVRGRRSEVVTAACLYIAGRRVNSPYILMDYSDITSINVFTLGTTVLRLLRSISTKLQLTDPSLFMSRYAHLLKLGNEKFTTSVTNTAQRILVHLKRDWIHTGRRPNGICGACLFLAARMHNVQCSISEIAQVVRIGEETILKRLDEFSNTNAVNMSVENLEKMDINAVKNQNYDWNSDEQMQAQKISDPPAYQKLQLREAKLFKMRQLLKERPNLVSLLSSSRNMKADVNTDSCDVLSDFSLDSILKQIQRSMRSNEVLSEQYEALQDSNDKGDKFHITAELELPSEIRTKKRLVVGEDGKEEVHEEVDSEEEVQMNKRQKVESRRRIYDTQRYHLSMGHMLTSTQVEEMSILRDDVLKLSLPPSVLKQGALYDVDVKVGIHDKQNNPLLLAQELAGSVEMRENRQSEEFERNLKFLEYEIECMKKEVELTPADVDEEEIKSWILDEAASQQKGELWTRLNREYLEDLGHRRYLQAHADSHEGVSSSSSSRSRKKGATRRNVTAAQTGERGISDKIAEGALHRIAALGVDQAVNITQPQPEVTATLLEDGIYKDMSTEDGFDETTQTLNLLQQQKPTKRDLTGMQLEKTKGLKSSQSTVVQTQQPPPDANLQPTAAKPAKKEPSKYDTNDDFLAMLGAI